MTLQQIIALCLIAMRGMRDALDAHNRGTIDALARRRLVIVHGHEVIMSTRGDRAIRLLQRCVPTLGRGA